MNFRHQDLINEAKKKELLRKLEIPEKDAIDFFSNDYLGISKLIMDEKLDIPLIQGGSTGSRLIAGNNRQMEDFEEYVAQSFNAEASLFFSSGYHANVALFSCIAQREEVILYDAYVHASIRDGILLTKASTYKFLHNDLDHLEKMLLSFQAKSAVYVVVDAIYSMTGEVSNVQKLYELANKFGFYLIIDESHSGGVLGKNGKGLAHDISNKVKNSIRLITYGKAFGFFGASILCSNTIKDYLINFSRPFIYTTAPPPSITLILVTILEYSKLEVLRVNLKNNISYFKNKVKEFDHRFIKSESQIQYYRTNSNEKAILLENNLKYNKINSKAIRSPTVPAKDVGIRFSIHAFNSLYEIDHLVDLLAKMDKNEA